MKNQSLAWAWTIPVSDSVCAVITTPIRAKLCETS